MSRGLIEAIPDPGRLPSLLWFSAVMSRGLIEARASPG